MTEFLGALILLGMLTLIPNGNITESDVQEIIDKLKTEHELAFHDQKDHDCKHTYKEIIDEQKIVIQTIKEIAEKETKTAQ